MKRNGHRVSVRRIDQAYRVVVTMDGLEHTLKSPIREKNDAWALAREVRSGLDQGDDLNLKHWQTKPL